MRLRAILLWVEGAPVGAMVWVGMPTGEPDFFHQTLGGLKAPMQEPSYTFAMTKANSPDPVPLIVPRTDLLVRVRHMRYQSIEVPLMISNRVVPYGHVTLDVSGLIIRDFLV